VSTRRKQVLAIGLVMAVSGCVRPSDPPPVSGPRTGDTPQDLAVSPRTSDLADQARHDVEQLRELDRQQAASAPGASQTAARRPEIQWIEQTGGRSAPTAPPTARSTARNRAAESDPAGEGDAGQAALGRDRPTGVEPSPEEPGGASPIPPSGSNETDRLRRLIVELSSELYRRGAYSDMPLRELLLIAATTLVTPDRGLATEALPGLTDREREILAAWQSFCARVGPLLAETGDPEVLVQEIEALHRALDRQPELVVAQASLCTRVGGFGDYDEFTRNAEGHYAFLAHSEQQAVVYVEIEDFSSEANEQGQWVTELAQQLVVISERDGIPVWREDWQAGVDLSRKRREDFFIVQVITLPERLSVGRYNLKIRIRDDHSGAEAEATIDFEMVADPRMASGQ
jgi:hypothetical protein